MKAGDPDQIDGLHDWAEFIVNHSRRVHKVARFLGLKETPYLHDIEEFQRRTMHPVGKFTVLVFRGLSPGNRSQKKLDEALTSHRRAPHHEIFNPPGRGWDEDLAMFSGVDSVVAAMETRHYGHPHLTMPELRQMAAGLKDDHQEYVGRVLDRIDLAGPRGFHGVFSIVQNPRVRVERFRILAGDEVVLDVTEHLGRLR